MRNPSWGPRNPQTYRMKYLFVGGSIVLDNGAPLQWKNAAGTVRTVLQMAADNHVYLDSVDGDIIFRTAAQVERGRFSDTAYTTTVPINVLATVNLTGQTADIGSTTLYAVPAGQSGFYMIYTILSVTNPGGISSTLPRSTITATNPDTSASNAYSITTTDTGNATTTYQVGVVVVYAKESTNITYSTSGYLSNPATTMSYSLHTRVVKMFA